MAVMPTAAFRLARGFSVTIDGETVTIPDRIYNEEPRDSTALTERQCDVLGCLYTRHNDGFVRQRHARAALILRLRRLPEGSVSSST